MNNLLKFSYFSVKKIHYKYRLYHCGVVPKILITAYFLNFPEIVILSGSPPKLWMFAWIYLRATDVSWNPKFDLLSTCLKLLFESQINILRKLSYFLLLLIEKSINPDSKLYLHHNYFLRLRKQLSWVFQFWTNNRTDRVKVNQDREILGTLILMLKFENLQLDWLCLLTCYLCKYHLPASDWTGLVEGLKWITNN